MSSNAPLYKVSVQYQMFAEAEVCGLYIVFMEACLCSQKLFLWLFMEVKLWSCHMREESLTAFNIHMLVMNLNITRSEILLGKKHKQTKMLCISKAMLRNEKPSQWGETWQCSCRNYINIFTLYDYYSASKYSLRLFWWLCAQRISPKQHKTDFKHFHEQHLKRNNVGDSSIYRIFTV